MTIRVFTTFQSIPTDIRGLLCFPSEPNFFRSLDWFELLFDTCLAATHRPHIYVEIDPSGKPACSLFCGVSDSPGRALNSLTNFYSIHYLPGFGPQGHNEAALHALTRHIASERPRWDTLHFSMLLDGPGPDALAEGLRAQGFACRRYFQYENWHAAVAGESFESYYAKRPSQLRNTIARKQKKLEKSHRMALRFSTAPATDLAQLVADFNAVYASSWKQPEPFPRFIPALAARCAMLGILRLGVLYVDDVAAAAQLWVTAGGRAIIYKLAYDEKYGALGVGSILSRELFRIALDEDHVEEIDYGVGSEPYKKDWMTAVRLIRGLQAHNSRTTRGLLLGTWEGAKATLKRWRPAAKPAEAAA